MSTVEWSGLEARWWPVSARAFEDPPVISSLRDAVLLELVETCVEKFFAMLEEPSVRVIRGSMELGLEGVVLAEVPVLRRVTPDPMPAFVLFPRACRFLDRIRGAWR